MKKILSLLAVVALVVAMVVPVFATVEDYLPLVPHENKEYVIQNLSGTYKAIVADTLVTMVSGGTDCVGSEYANLYILQDGEWVLLYSNQTVSFIKTNLVYDSTGRFLQENKIAFDACDGSACSATDVNEDNVCDECGVPFAVLRNYSTPDPYTVWTEEKQAIYPYAFIYTDNNGSDWLILSADPATYSDGAITIASGNHARYSVFGTSWNLVSTYEDYSTYGNVAEVYPSYNMRADDGTVAYAYNSDFFPKPLWEQMGMVTQGEMGQLTQTTAGTITILVLCGVGLMALLVVLKLFGKRSLISRG